MSDDMSDSKTDAETWDRESELSNNDKNEHYN